MTRAQRDFYGWLTDRYNSGAITKNEWLACTMAVFHLIAMGERWSKRNARPN